MFLWARVSRNAATLGCNDSRLGGLATPTPVVLLVSEACGTKGDEAGWIAAEQSRGLGKDCQLSGDCLLSVFYQRGGGGGRSVADGAQRMERSGWSAADGAERSSVEQQGRMNGQLLGAGGVERDRRGLGRVQACSWNLVGGQIEGQLCGARVGLHTCLLSAVCHPDPSLITHKSCSAHCCATDKLEQ